jgi:hypothetical protein
MDPVTPHVRYPLRDPMGDASRYEEIFETTYSRLQEQRLAALVRGGL